MNEEVLIKVENVNMSFKVPEFKFDTLKERFVNLLKKRKNKTKVFDVLKNINFELKKGESLGIIGHNGAGKSTLLKLIAGTYTPTSGKIVTNGKVVLLNLGAGFDMEANAEENIYLSGALLGFTRKEIRKKFESILQFAELENFRKLPLKNYSSGMISRLGFAIAIDVKADILLIDEILSVGDSNFQKKCMQKIEELRANGTSFVFVSHNISQVKYLCPKTLWLENSKVMAYGNSEDVCKQYFDYCNNMAKTST